MLKALIGTVVVLMLSVSARAAPAYTYKYHGQAFAGSTNFVTVRFTTTAPLAPSTSYLDSISAAVTSVSISTSGQGGFTVPVTTFQLHTDASGAIDSWFIFGDLNTLAGTAPTMTGSDWQVYTINTRAFIPGSDIGGSGLVMGHYDYEQATQTTFYDSCTAAPAGCTLAGDGQPYTGDYSGIINPSHTSGSDWSVISTTVAMSSPSSCETVDAGITDFSTVQATVADSCPCTAFNNLSPDTSRKAYLDCVTTQATSITVTSACTRSVKRISRQSVCGFTPGKKHYIK